MKSVLVLFVLIATLGFAGTSYAQSSGGVDVDGTWYLGEGLKNGDYFEYTMCEIDLNACSPIDLKIWIKGEKQNVSETLWDAQVLVVDGDKTIKGSWGLGKTVPTPIIFDDDLSDYAVAFESSIAWISSYATSNEKDRIHGPQEFKSASWGSLGPVGGGLESYLIPSRVESITFLDGTSDSVVIGWYNDNDNEIWLVDDFPFPVKALTFAGINSDSVPVMFEFNLTQYEEGITDDPFKDVAETIQRSKLLKCDMDFSDYTSDRIPTNTYSMMIQYNYSPLSPVNGCDMDWKIYFYSKFNEIEILDQVNYDIWVVDENDNKLYSYAESIGKEKMFNQFGQVGHVLPVEQSGLVRYAVFVHGLGPEDQVDEEYGGYAIIEVPVENNPLLDELSDVSDNVISSEADMPIPDWIKSNAGWWADGQIGDDAFVSGIQFLIEEEILQISLPEHVISSEADMPIPDWIKSNAGWWADGQIGDDAFVSGIKYLVENGIVRIS
ncbi:MAG: peptidase [Nitrosopumilus sp.]|nr:MAG: peptidase [Nitrosopumilus sp.]